MKKNSRNKNKRPQAPKAQVQAFQDLRRSNATVPIPSGKRYKREKAGARGREW